LSSGKSLKELSPESLRNPSDSDASCDSRGGKNYQDRITEAFNSGDKEEDEVKSPNLIISAAAEPAHNHDGLLGFGLGESGRRGRENEGGLSPTPPA
jgi:hypothetical protein